MIGAWIQTYTGRQFSYECCTLDEISIVDIARALSHICRFTGHSKCFYSVAQHSVLVSEQCSHPFLGLMHDATEAYVGDMNRPLKSKLPSDSIYKRIDDNIWEVMQSKWPSLAATQAQIEECKKADLRMLVTESHDVLWHGPHAEWDINQTNYPRYDFTIKPWSPDEAMERFLARYRELLGLASHEC